MMKSKHVIQIAELVLNRIENFIFRNFGEFRTRVTKTEADVGRLVTMVEELTSIVEHIEDKEPL